MSLIALFVSVDDFCLTYAPYVESVQLVTPICKNMKNRLLLLMDKIPLRKRSFTETVNDQLKSIAQIDHTHPRTYLTSRLIFFFL